MPKTTQTDSNGQEPTLDAATYWRIKAATLQHENGMMKLQAMAQEATASYHEVLRGAGLDPAQRYRLDDQTQTATVVLPEETSRAE
jgi:hypothetical protein